MVRCARDVGVKVEKLHGDTQDISTRDVLCLLLAIGSASLSYDAKGNLTQDTSRSPTQNYIWDFDHKMKSADIDGNGSSDVTFEFDALSRRVARMQLFTTRSTSKRLPITHEVAHPHQRPIATSGLLTLTNL